MNNSTEITNRSKYKRMIKLIRNKGTNDDFQGSYVEQAINTRNDCYLGILLRDALLADWLINRSADPRQSKKNGAQEYAWLALILFPS